MSKINPTESLQSSIAVLEQKKDDDFRNLKYHLKETGQSLKPANLIKGAIRDVASSEQIRSILIKAAIGLAAGYVAKKLITRQRKTTKNLLIGNAIQYGISFLASPKNNLLRSAGIMVANSVIEGIRRRRAQRQLQNGAAHQIS